MSPKARQPASFPDDLIRINRLDMCGFSRFVFFPGMMFGSTEKWWGKKGTRQSSHEGLDFCFFEDHTGRKFRLDASAQVPALYDGEVVHITDDFLGKTVIFHHAPVGLPAAEATEAGLPETGLLALYGHLRPDKNLAIGDRLRQRDVFARISPVKERWKKLLPHVHISLAKPERLPRPDRIEWTFLNTVDRSVFFDPLDYMAPEYRVMAYDASLAPAKIFTPWTGVNGPNDE